MNKLHVLGIVALSVVAFEGVAAAQTTPKKSSSVEVMIFDDDKMFVVPVSPTSAQIGGGHVKMINILVRPRVTFAPELVKSIENL
ncbi:MAG: hypothetical protein ACHREM_19060 [Polyangiales bacterium]